MTLEELLWALFKTDLVLIAVIIMYAITTWEGSHITDEIQVTTKYKIANALFKTFVTLLPLIVIALIWV